MSKLCERHETLFFHSKKEVFDPFGAFPSAYQPDGLNSFRPGLLDNPQGIHVCQSWILSWALRNLKYNITLIPNIWTFVSDLSCVLCKEGPFPAAADHQGFPDIPTLFSIFKSRHPASKKILGPFGRAVLRGLCTPLPLQLLYLTPVSSELSFEHGKLKLLKILSQPYCEM